MAASITVTGAVPPGTITRGVWFSIMGSGFTPGELVSHGWTAQASIGTTRPGYIQGAARADANGNYLIPALMNPNAGESGPGILTAAGIGGAVTVPIAVL